MVPNKVLDPDFTDINNTNKFGWVYWTTKSVENGTVTVTKSSSGQARTIIKCQGSTTNNNIYASVLVKFTPSDGTIQNNSAYVSANDRRQYLTQDDYDQWIEVSLVSYAKNNEVTMQIGLENANTSPSYTVMFKNPLIVDMTAYFGKGNELTADEASEYFKYYGDQVYSDEVIASKVIANDLDARMGRVAAENIFPAKGNYYSPQNYTKATVALYADVWSDTSHSKNGDGNSSLISVGSAVFAYNNAYAALVGSELNDLFYFGAMVKTNVPCEYFRATTTNNVLNPLSNKYRDYTSNANEWTHVSVVDRFSGTQYLTVGAIYSDSTVQGTATLEYKCGIVINLTKTFGAGSEPTKEQMDVLLSRYDNYWYTARRYLFSADVIRYINKRKNIEPLWNGSYGFDGEGAYVCDSHVDSSWSGWANGRYGYGQRPAVNKVYSKFDHSVVSDGMFISDGKSGAWTTEGSGQDSYGGHVFQGWNEIGTFRVSLMIGNTRVGGVPREDEAALLVYSPTNRFANPDQPLTPWQEEHRMTPAQRDYYGNNSQLLLGRIRLGSDVSGEGLLIERKRFTHFGDIVQTSNASTYRKLIFNNDGTVTWTDCTDEMNDPT